MNRSVKKKTTAGQTLYQQLSIFDSIGFDALTKEVVSQLTQPDALAASGLLDALPSLHSYFRINQHTVLTPSGETAKLAANVTAIRLAKQLLGEDRPASDEEKKTISSVFRLGGTGKRLESGSLYRIRTSYRPALTLKR